MDLFEHYKTLPVEVQNIISSMDDNKCLYKECRRMLKELKPLGYTFDFGLCGTPYDLTIIN